VRILRCFGAARAMECYQPLNSGRLRGSVLLVKEMSYEGRRVGRRRCAHRSINHIARRAVSSQRN
jgi:hypothetical protein